MLVPPGSISGRRSSLEDAFEIVERPDFGFDGPLNRRAHEQLPQTCEFGVQGKRQAGAALDRFEVVAAVWAGRTGQRLELDAVVRLEDRDLVVRRNSAAQRTAYALRVSHSNPLTRDPLDVDDSRAPARALFAIGYKREDTVDRGSNED
jgi:hypothetical protein